MTSRTLVRALGRVGLELAGPLGTGSGGARPVARDVAGRGWAVTVLDPGTLPRDELRARVAALAVLEHPHVAAVAPLLELRDGTAVALQAEVVGPDLATVARARGPWRPGEVVTLVVPLARALAALHEAGLAHGDVAPGNVVLEADGRPVLVDLVCGAATAELGTPGLAAPERPRGAEPAGDVHALGRLALALLGEGPDAAGWRAEPDGAALRAVLESACAAEPAARPGAAALAEAVYATCPAEPVDLPDAAVLARLTLRRLAAPPEDVTVVRPDLVPASRRGRHRRSSGARGPAVVAAVGLVAAGAFVALERSGGAFAGEGATVTADAEAVAVPAPGPRSDAGPGDPLAAAGLLTVRRAEALGGRDVVALTSVTVPGSAAARADRRLAGALWRASPSGGGAVVQEVHLLALEGPVPGRPREARVLVRSRARVTTGTSASPESPEDPSAPSSAPAAVSVVLVLEGGPTGWRVSDVEPAPDA